MRLVWIYTGFRVEPGLDCMFLTRNSKYRWSMMKKETLFFYVMTEASEDSSVFNITADTVRTSSGVPLITVEVCKLLIYMIDTVLSSKAPLRYTSTATACSASSIINSNTQPPATVISSTMTLNTSKRTDDNSITSSELYLIVGLALSGVVVCGTASCTIFLVALIEKEKEKQFISS